MTAPEARALLAAPPTEGLRVRYLYDTHGDIVFRATPIPSSMLVRTRRAAAVAAVIALPLALAACMGAPVQPARAAAPSPVTAGQTIEPPMPIMGAPVAPAPSASAPVKPTITQ
jgi:hypothetical protein